MAQISSPGQCRLCSAAVTKATVSRHLAACAKSRRGKAPTPPEKNSGGRWLHLATRGAFDPRYWLHLAAPAEAALWELDTVLRDIWLECCGHMSSFQIGGKYFNESPWGGADSLGDAEPMEASLGDVLHPGDRFVYEYDFGTTTELAGQVLADLPAVFPKRGIRLLARNDAPEFRCAGCGRPATRICGYCASSGDAAFCEACARKHRCEVELAAAHHQLAADG